jgi:hypothetical protein
MRLASHTTCFYVAVALSAVLSLSSPVGLSAQPPGESQTATSRSTHDPALTGNYVAFDKVGEYVWDRPNGVEFILVQGCGGGGGGAGNGTVQPTRNGRLFTPSIGGGGGGAATIKSHTVGPLERSRYYVRIGNGGRGSWIDVSRPEIIPIAAARSGEETVFAELDKDGSRRVILRFAGGVAGQMGRYDPAKAAQQYQPAVSSLGAIPGGGGGQDGASTDWAVGGKGQPPTKIGLLMVPGSGGGGAGLRPGGNGGTTGVAAAGTEGVSGGSCAGGGGGGASPHSLVTQQSAYGRGGDGGNGFLQIVPLVSATALSEQVKNLLEQLRAAQQENSTKN